ncbi:3239_t:CDS:2, partial [Ambispora leptoticha]
MRTASSFGGEFILENIDASKATNRQTKLKSNIKFFQVYTGDLQLTLFRGKIAENKWIPSTQRTLPQKFLAEAIAHNDDSKRKLEQLEDFVTQIPLKANHNLNITSIPHADLSGQESLSDSPESPQDSSEPQKKKPGRKPLTNTPSSKRKAQNRAAQRAFRERKERYVKELETKIKDLESQTAKTTHENAQLKSLVEQLQAENYFLKQSTFAFDFSLDNNKTPEDSLALDK